MTTPAIATELETDFEDAVERTRAALQEQGFGVLTEIDMQSTLRAKIGEEIERYVVLGACNPPIAHRAVQLEPTVGLLLPCNVVVREDRERPGIVRVEAMDPDLMVQVTGRPELEPVAAEASARLGEAIANLSR
ncbi:DUF302 domain-containing protein [Rhodococcus rhodnii]|uniref:DUF302 domain-containing protein n=2 Tax=Rhodococcus rhodnii TaxID=38312 RepID=R7WHX7_9NOCA|nr:DUF302 domain-containing protein [Rhodococcus rhodnii]EOM74761.1 hypothetical protein Rrhod_3924 [Rhodococcus rhodnii LMG 5362]TXG89858.1 DUF302 domain-containing protein [Rhodococcus rhodnii]